MSVVRSRRGRRAEKAVVEEKKEKLGLQDLLQETDLVKIHDIFHRDASKSMNQATLRKMLRDVAKLKFNDHEFGILFLKMNTARNGLVTWDEFISYLILGFQEKEVSTEFQSLEAPISKPPRTVRSNHRHPVNRITFCPMVRSNRTYNYSDGSYLTCSKDGVINYWTLDMQIERTVQSVCPDLKVQPTWVTDVLSLPDVNVVCTSSSERDLRFYDTSARKFELRVIITSLESAVCCMYYTFSQSIEEESKVILGDMSGSVRIILFSPKVRGPFKSQPGVPLLRYRYDDLLKGRAPGFRVVEFKHVHTDWTKQVSYYEALRCIVSCSSCPKVTMLMRDLSDNKSNYVYKLEKGATCFALMDNPHLVATGGSDCIVRVWNPFVPEKPSGVFIGHHAGIVALIIQEGKKVFSLSKDRCIKIWDVASQTCIQNYYDLPSELGEHTEYTLLYNPDNRQVIIGSVIIAILEFCPLQSGEHTDGKTHSLGVSCVLYNPLFKIIVSCGLDSYIIVWDPWLGRRMSVVKNAHTHTLRGELIPLEITAACFDPGYQLLLTGATDGSLKMWNFNTGTCLRNMKIETDCEITSIVWVKGRILASGWNKHITEFADSGGAAGPGGSSSKNWGKRHTEDILSTVVRVPQSLVTATYNGELIMWHLETGQPYKRYNVANPTGRIKIHYRPEREKHKIAKASSTGVPGRRSWASFIVKRKSMLPGLPQSEEKGLLGPSRALSRAKKLSVIQMPEAVLPLRGLAVHTMLFLCSRSMDPEVGSLLVGLENGQIQVWSHHVAGGFMGSFSAVHMAGDYVISLASDANNEYLFTGTCAGYIKIWLMKNYMLGEKVPISLPRYRLIFPFLWKDLWEGRAKRANRGQALPVLLNSFKAHVMPISGLDYIMESKIIISSSADNCVRLWTLAGRYLGTLGTFKRWIPIEPDVPPDDKREYMIPAETKRVASSTTMKVYLGGQVQRRFSQRKEEEKDERLRSEMDTLRANVYGKRVEEPILGNYYSLPERTIGRQEFELDTSYPYIPVYQHLIMPPARPFERPKTPEIIKAIRLREKEKIKHQQRLYKS